MNAALLGDAMHGWSFKIDRDHKGELGLWITKGLVSLWVERVEEGTPIGPLTLLDKSYDGESIVDVSRDVHEAFIADFTPAVSQIPTDEHHIQKGSFHVLINWRPTDE